jgi:hypothetical protein
MNLALKFQKTVLTRYFHILILILSINLQFIVTQTGYLKYIPNEPCSGRISFLIMGMSCHYRVFFYD